MFRVVELLPGLPLALLDRPAPAQAGVGKAAVGFRQSFPRRLGALPHLCPKRLRACAQVRVRPARDLRFKAVDLLHQPAVLLDHRASGEPNTLL